MEVVPIRVQPALVNLQYLVDGPDAAGGFDADLLREVLAHQRDVRQRVAGGRKARGGLHEIDFSPLAAHGRR